MLLSEYFEDYFYSLKQLAQHSGLAESELLDWQENCLLPNAAYHIKNQVETSSFFGICDYQEQKSYYPRGYTRWIEQLKRIEKPSSAQAYHLFFQHYAKSLTELMNSGLTVPDNYLENLDEHVQRQWQLFLAGKYGVLTANGFIHEIVALALSEFLAEEELASEHKDKCIRLLERSLCFPPKQLNFNSNAHNLLVELKAD